MSLSTYELFMKQCVNIYGINELKLVFYKDHYDHIGNKIDDLKIDFLYYGY